MRHVIAGGVMIGHLAGSLALGYATSRFVSKQLGKIPCLGDYLNHDAIAVVQATASSGVAALYSFMNVKDVLNNPIYGPIVNVLDAVYQSTPSVRYVASAVSFLYSTALPIVCPYSNYKANVMHCANIAIAAGIFNPGWNHKADLEHTKRNLGNLNEDISGLNPDDASIPKTIQAVEALNKVGVSANIANATYILPLATAFILPLGATIPITLVCGGLNLMCNGLIRNDLNKSKARIEELKTHKAELQAAAGRE